MINLGELIKQERKETTVRKKLAAAIGVSRQTILNWEKGRTLPDSAGSALCLSAYAPAKYQ